jgi:TPR repeat protein
MGPATRTDRTGVLSEDLFWFGEKMRQGYEGVAPNPEAALNLYKAAAATGFPQAYLRLGEMYERGFGTAVYVNEALETFKMAAERGEIVGYAARARLASRTKEDEKAEVLWRRFLEELAFADTHNLDVDEPATSIHAYLFSKLARSEQPTLFPVMMRYRSELIAYIQRYLEYATDERQLEVMQAMMDWVAETCRSMKHQQIELLTRPTLWHSNPLCFCYSEGTPHGFGS